MVIKTFKKALTTMPFFCYSILGKEMRKEVKIMLIRNVPIDGKTIGGFKEGKCKEYFPYETIRPSQESILESLDKIYASPKKYRYIVIEAGTGIGKSAIAKAISKKEGSCYLLTATKQLQDQYIDDFGFMGASAIKGAVNYECAQDEGMPCSNGECKFTSGIYADCMKHNLCPYMNARKKAEMSEMFVTSYAYFLRASRGREKVNDEEYRARFAKRNALIIDECHMIEDQLINCAGFTLSKEYLDKKFNLSHGLDFKTLMLYKKSFTEDGYKANEKWLLLVQKLLLQKANKLFNQVKMMKVGNLSHLTADQLTDLAEKDIRTLSQELDDAKRLYEKITDFLNRSDEEKEEWIVSVSNKTKISAKPIEVDNLFKNLVDGFAVNKVVFMSATILDKEGFCRDMGITPDTTAFITRDGIFPAKKSPIVYMPVGSMNYASLPNTMPKMIEEIKRILALHPNEKGIIHTGTYSVANQIAEALKEDKELYKRIVYRETGTESNETLYKYHIQLKEPTVLLSPSLMAGVDLHDDLSRFQIVVKMPYISMTDERVKRKMNKNRKWYTCKMLRNLVQECGRSTRNENDWAVTYVLDQGFENVLRYNRNMLQPSFLNRIVKAEKFDLKDYRREMMDE